MQQWHLSAVLGLKKQHHRWMGRYLYPRVLYSELSSINEITSCLNYSTCSSEDEFIRLIHKIESVILVPTRLLDIPAIPGYGFNNSLDVFHSLQSLKETLRTASPEDQASHHSSSSLASLSSSTGSLSTAASSTCLSPPFASSNLHDVTAIARYILDRYLQVVGVGE